MSGANGLPRQQVPVPSQTPPPWLGICAGPSEGSDGKGRGPRSTWVDMYVLLPSGMPGCCSRFMGKGRDSGGSALLSLSLSPIPRHIFCVR